MWLLNRMSRLKGKGLLNSKYLRITGDKLKLFVETWFSPQIINYYMTLLLLVPCTHIEEIKFRYLSNSAGKNGPIWQNRRENFIFFFILLYQIICTLINKFPTYFHNSI